MKRLQILALSMLITATAHAEPMSGSYSVGGEGPDFDTIGDAVTALSAQGISGPVTLNLRPATYVESGGTERALEILQPIVGADPATRVTFRPDAASGANRDNVILQRSGGTHELGRGFVVEIRSDGITLEDLTIEYAETVGGQDSAALGLTSPSAASAVDGVTISGCQIVSSGVRMRRGINVTGVGTQIVIADNHVETVHWGISVYGTFGSYADLIIADNYVTGLAYIFLGSVYGAGIDASNAGDAVIRNNTIAYDGGSGIHGIRVSGQSDGAQVESNLITEARGYGHPCNGYDAIRIENGATEVRIANNMIAGIYATGGRGINVTGDDNEIVYNTVTHGYGSAGGYCVPTALTLSGSGNTVRNNIFVQHRSLPYPGYIMSIANTADNIFDDNVLYQAEDTQRLIFANGQIVNTLEDWQTLGHGLSSINKLPEFVDEFLDLHLSGCSAVDSELMGTPLAGFSADFDGDARDGQAPFMGADEGDGEIPSAFALPDVYATSDEALHFASEDLDGDGDADLAVTNLETGSNDVSLFWNDGSGTFGAPSHIAFGNRPTVIRSVDLDEDGAADLLATTDPGNDGQLHLTVRWGNSGGTFDAPENVEFIESVDDVVFLDLNGNGRLDIFQTHPGLVGSVDGDVSQFINLGGRSLLFANMGPYDAGQYPSSAVAAELNGDAFPDVAVVDYVNGTVGILINRGATGGIWDGFEDGDIYQVSTGSSPLHANLAAGDIDGDGHTDVVVGGEWGIGVDSLHLLRNNGDGSFAPFEAIPLDTRHRSETFALFDYDDDGDLDVATANITHNVSLFLNDGFGAFEPYLLCQNSELGGEPLTVLAAELNGDASTDLAVLTLTDDVVVMLNVGWIPTGVGALGEDEPGGVRNTAMLKQNYPNPFNPQTRIRFVMNDAAHARLTIYDLRGRLVATLLDEAMPAGDHSVTWTGRDRDGREVPSGVYLTRLEAGGQVAHGRMALIK